MQHLETCLLISEADRILCHVVMFLACSRRSDSGERCKVKGSAKK